MKHLFATLFLATALALQAALPLDVLENLSSPDLTKRLAAETKLRQLAFQAGKPGADPAMAATLEKDLLALASDPEVSELMRLSALEQLPYLASASAVPGLGTLLFDPIPLIREGARCALQNNPDPAASAPLLQALDKADNPEWTLGLIDSLAMRGDAAAIPALAARLDSPNPAIASLAAQSLGSIGGKESFKALRRFLPNCPPATLPVAQSAFVRCALPLTKPPAGLWERVVAAAEKFLGTPTASEAIVDLWPKASNAAVRCEIFNAMAGMGDGSQATPLLVELLAKQDTPGAVEIFRLAILSRQPVLKTAVLSALPNLNEDARLAVHAAMAKDSDNSREDDLLALAAALDEKKKAVAIELLGACGTEKSLGFLLAEAAKNSPVTIAAASGAINRLSIPGLDQRLMQEVKAKSKPQSISLLAFRNPDGAEALITQLAAPDAAADIQTQALSVLEITGGLDSATRLISWIGTAPQGADSKPYIAAFRRIAPRLKSESAIWESAFVPAFQTASAENREALFLTLPALCCPQSAATMVEWIRSDTGLQSTAVNQLASWSDFIAADFILEAALVPGLDESSREKLLKAATKFFYPTVKAKSDKKKEYAKKVLAAAPEGPIHDFVQNAIVNSKIEI